MKKMITILASAMSIGLMVMTVSATNYELVVVGDTAGESCAYAVNNYGYTVGFKTVGGKYVPTVWGLNRGEFVLSGQDGTANLNGSAYAINDWFEIAGNFGILDSTPYRISSGPSTVWVFDMNVSDFCPYAITSYGVSRDISENSVVAGHKSDFGFTEDIYTGSGYSSSMSYSICFGVNDSGSACGTVFGSMIFLIFIERKSDGSYSTISGWNQFGYASACGIKINNQNQVVGTSTLGGIYWEPKSGVCTAFGAGTYCFGINDSSTIVGSTNGRACMWQKTGVSQTSFRVTDLNSLTGNTNYTLISAFDVNRVGQIVGAAVDNVTGLKSAYVLTPVIEVRHSISARNGKVLLSWPSSANKTYIVKSGSKLGTWDADSDVFVAAGDHTEIEFSPIGGSRFFRVLEANQYY